MSADEFEFWSFARGDDLVQWYRDQGYELVETYGSGGWFNPDGSYTHFEEKNGERIEWRDDDMGDVMRGVFGAWVMEACGVPDRPPDDEATL